MPIDAGTGLGARPAETLGRLDRGVVTVATISSAVFFVMLVVAGLAGQDERSLFRAFAPLAVGGVGVVQLARHRPQPLVQLGVGTLVMALDVWRYGPEPSSHMGLLAMALAGVLFVRRHVLLYVLGATLALAAASIVWVPPDRPPLQRLAEESGHTVLFVFMSSLVHWMRVELEKGQARYRDLFYRAQVPIWEIDYSAVGEWLQRRRAEGVTDLAEYLAEHPDALREAGALARVLDANAAAAEFVGATRRESLVGLVRFERLPNGLREGFVAQLHALWAGEPDVVAEVSLTRRDGSVVEGAMSSAVPERSGRFDLSNVVTTATDVTERNRTQQRLEELVRAKDEFIATISHELRTPLTAVVGLAEELANRFDDFDRTEAHEVVSTISEQGLEVAYIVEDLLVAARNDIGSLVLDCRTFDLQRETVGVVSGLAYDVEVEADLLVVAPLTWADPARVRQVLRNLLVNAERHGGGSIRVRTRFTATNSYVEVRDAGPPIPAAERDAIFQRYYASPQVAGLTASVGLGLTVSRQLANLMGGDVMYEHDGLESVFTLLLPNAPAAAPAPTLAAAQ